MRAESDKCIHRVLKYFSGKGVDIGFGGYKISWPNTVYVDRDNHGDNVVSDATCLKFRDQEFDFVFSSHCLEHIVDLDKAINEWWRILKLNGSMILYLPLEGVYPDCSKHPDHKHNLSPSKVETLLIKNNLKFTIIHSASYNTVPANYRFTCNGFTEKADNFEYSFEMVIQKNE